MHDDDSPPELSLITMDQQEPSTLEPTALGESTVYNKNTPKQHTCTECSKSFKTRQRLTQHQRTHSGEKPFRCTVCKKCFSRSHHLEGHMTVHSDYRPYKCQLCGSGFKQASHLKLHHKVDMQFFSFNCCTYIGSIAVVLSIKSVVYCNCTFNTKCNLIT